MPQSMWPIGDSSDSEEYRPRATRRLCGRRESGGLVEAAQQREQGTTLPDYLRVVGRRTSIILQAGFLVAVAGYGGYYHCERRTSGRPRMEVGQ